MVSRLSLSVLLSVTLGFSPPAAAQEQDYNDVVTDAAGGLAVTPEQRVIGDR